MIYSYCFFQLRMYINYYITQKGFFMTISGPTPENSSYRKDFQESVNLFEKSFKGVQTSTFDEQRTQFVKVMQDSLRTMQESANGLLNERLITLKNTLSNDLNQYLDSPTAEHQQKVQSDLNQIKSEE